MYVLKRIASKGSRPKKATLWTCPQGGAKSLSAKKVQGISKNIKNALIVLKCKNVQKFQTIFCKCLLKLIQHS